MNKKAIIASGAMAAAVLLPVAASASPGGTSTAPKLQFFNCVTDGAAYGPCNTTQPGSANWVKTDAAHGFSLALTTAVNDSSAVSYAGENVLNVPVIGQTLAQVTALGFDTSGFSDGGAPRLSLVMDDGNVVWLDPSVCGTSVGGGWTHADFRTAVKDAVYNPATDAPCTINSTYGTFSSGVDPHPEDSIPATNFTAWNWLNEAALNAGNAHIAQVLLVQDWGPGTSYNDNLTLDSVVISAQPGQAKKS